MKYCTLKASCILLAGELIYIRVCIRMRCIRVFMRSMHECIHSMPKCTTLNVYAYEVRVFV